MTLQEKYPLDKLMTRGEFVRKWIGDVEGDRLKHILEDLDKTAGFIVCREVSNQLLKAETKWEEKAKREMEETEDYFWTAIEGFKKEIEELKTKIKDI